MNFIFLLSSHLSKQETGNISKYWFCPQIVFSFSAAFIAFFSRPNKKADPKIMSQDIYERERGSIYINVAMSIRVYVAHTYIFHNQAVLTHFPVFWRKTRPAMGESKGQGLRHLSRNLHHGSKGPVWRGNPINPNKIEALLCPSHDTLQVPKSGENGCEAPEAEANNVFFFWRSFLVSYPRSIYPIQSHFSKREKKEVEEKNDPESDAQRSGRLTLCLFIPPWDRRASSTLVSLSSVICLLPRRNWIGSNRIHPLSWKKALPNASLKLFMLWSLSSLRRNCTQFRYPQSPSFVKLDKTLKL